MSNYPNRRLLDKHFISQLVSTPVKEFSLSAGSKQGDNVMGNLLSLDVKTESNEIHHVILKTVLPMTSVIDQNVLSQSEFMSGLKAFPREILYYKEILPIFQDATKDVSKLGRVFSRPKYYSSYSNEENGLHDYLAIEDLRPSGYKMLDKFKGLSLEHFISVLKDLAIFHAVSYAVLNGSKASKKFCEMRDDKSSYLNMHGWDPSSFPIADHSMLYNGLISGMIRLVSNLGQVEAASKMEKKFAGKGHQNLLALWKQTGTDDKYFTVLCHSDLWTNNVLFKLAPDGRSVEDLKLIDFQQIRFGNIYEDLHYFIFTSTTPELRRGYLDSSLKIYFQEFESALKEMASCPLPRGFCEEQLITTFHENLDYGIGYNLVTIPFQLGIPPPPPSPKSPVDLEKLGKGQFFSTDKKLEKVDSFHTDFQKLEEDTVKGLLEGAKNSPVAKKWLMELVDEIIERDVI